MKRKSRFTMYVLICTLLGLLSVYSASKNWAGYKFNDEFYFFKRQCIFACIGIVGFFICSKMDIVKYKKYNTIIFIVSLIALVLVLIPGLGVERNGSRSWFQVGPLYIQPSEFFKIAVILVSSGYLVKIRKIQSFFHHLLPLLTLVGLGFLLILLQPDFGSGVVMICSIVVLVLVANAPIRYFVRVGMVGVLGLVGLILSAPYRLARITSFIDPWQDPLGAGFQMIQSLFAIGPGGLLGVGFNQSIQKRFYLPEPQTDFIFAIFAEEFGFIGSALLIVLYALIVYEAVKIILACSDLYVCYVGMGLISLFTIQVLINLGVVVGLFPVTGITLPLFSYGGSSLVVMLCSLGLIKSISNKQ